MSTSVSRFILERVQATGPIVANPRRTSGLSRMTFFEVGQTLVEHTRVRSAVSLRPLCTPGYNLFLPMIADRELAQR